MPILMTRTGESVKVAGIAGRDSDRQRLGELGFIAGTPVTVMQARGGDMIVKIGDSRLALTREMAAKIMVDIMQ